MTKLIAKKTNRLRNLFVALGITILIVGYFFIRSEINHRLDSKIYASLETMDSQLDKLAMDAVKCREFKLLNRQITTTVRGLTPKTYDHSSEQLRLLIESVAQYAPQTARDFTNLMSTTSNTNYKWQKRQFKLEVRELKYGYNQQVKQFNQQISGMLQQLTGLEQQVGEIHSSDLQDLERARIKFIRHKLRTVDEKIKANLLLETLENLDGDESASLKK